MEDSLLDPDRTPRDGGLLDASYSEEVRRLLRGPDTDLSTSMQVSLRRPNASDRSPRRRSLTEARPPAPPPPGARCAAAAAVAPPPR
jgi:hypothetical protein